MRIKDVANFSKLFKTEYGEPLELSPGQREIFRTVVSRKPKRNWVSCITQYGKSMTVALGMIVRASIYPEKWCIIGATLNKTRIIMNYVIGHCFDNPLFESQLEWGSLSDKERLKRERSKNRLTFRRGGEIFILSAQATNSQAVVESLLGFGAPNVIVDDSPLLSDKLHAMVKRMLGSKKDNFLIELGNPFYRNHFLKSFRNPKYNKIKVDYKQAIKENRVTPEFIAEMRKEAYFDILYKCEFPDASMVDEKGWSLLFSDTLIEKIMKKQVKMEGPGKLGIDVGGGKALNAYVLRTPRRAKVIYKDRNPDTMGTCAKTQELIEELKLNPEDVSIDDTGIGHGVTDRLYELGVYVNRVTVGEAATEKDRFINKRAELYWQARNWCSNGGTLSKDDEFMQLLDIKYKTESDRRIKLMSKDEMRRNGIASPDVADAFSLTFAEPEPIPRVRYL